MVEEKKEKAVEKYPVARRWNEFVLCMQKAREKWEDVQRELDGIGRREIEDYPIVAQKHLGRFRNTKFEWMASMFVDYYRGAGGLDSMFIILPPENKKKGEGK